MRMIAHATTGRDITVVFFFFQAEDGIRDLTVTGVQTCALPISPTADAPRAAQRVKEVLEVEPPYGARVTFSTGERPGSGWDAPVMADWLRDSVTRAARAYFNAPPMFDGLGGTIPFMSMLGERFPQAQFLVTGVMGPGSNAHGPNEFIDLPTGVKVTACVAQVLADHWRSAPSARR